MNGIDIDVEIRDLVMALNKVPGIMTTSSCFGHGKADCRIYFMIDSIKHLNEFLWAGCHRWFSIMHHDFKTWTLEMDNCDTDVKSDVLSLLLYHPPGASLLSDICALTDGIEKWMDFVDETLSGSYR